MINKRNNTSKTITNIISKVWVLIMVFSILGTTFMNNFIIHNNEDVYVYAEESKDEKKDDKKDDSTIGSSGDNMYNILSQSRSANKLYLKNLDEILKYDSNLHYLTTLAVLNNELVAKGDYGKIYTGNFQPKGVPDSYNSIKTNGTELFGLLGKLEKEDSDRIKDEGISDKVVEEIFGKKRADLDKKQKTTLETLEKIAKDKDERGKQKSDFNTKAVEQSAEYLCSTAYMSSGYGGAGFITWNNDAKWIENWGWQDTFNMTADFVHTVVNNEDLKGGLKLVPEGKAKDACITNFKKFHNKGDNRADATNSVITRTLNMLTKDSGNFSEDSAKSLVEGIINSKGTGSYGSGEYKKVSSKYSLADDVEETDGYGFLGRIFKPIYSLDTSVKARSTYSTIPQKILGTGNKKDEEYRSVANISKKGFEDNILPNMNKIYGTSYKKEDFGVVGNGDGSYKFNNRNAYDTLNKYMTINLITAERMERNTYKDNKGVYDKTIKTLKNHPYVLYSKYESDIVGGVSEDLKGTKALGWMPLYYNSNTDGTIGVEGLEKYTKLMKDHDESSVNGDLASKYIQAHDGLRTVKLRDLIPLKHNGTYSPLMAYDSESKKRPFATTYGRQTTYFNNVGVYSALELEGKKIKALGKDSRSKNHRGAYQEYFSKDSSANGLKGQEAIGIDNYGNVIIGNGLKPVIPYWHVLPGGDKIFATPIFKKSEGINWEVSSMVDIKGVDGEDVYAFDVRKNELNTVYAEGVLGSKKDVKKAVTSGGAGKDIRVLAHRITKATEDEVKKHNANFISAYNEAYENGDGELYVTSAIVSEDEEEDLESLKDEFTEADILHKIAMLMKYGFSDLLRLTFVGFFVDFYNSTVYNFNVSEVFYSTTFVDSELYKRLLPSLTYIVGMVTALFLVVAVIQLNREQITWKRFLGVILALTFVLMMPYLYKFIIDYGMNKPSDKMLGKTTRQMMVVDSWTRSIERAVKDDDSFSRLYGFNKDVEFRDSGQDYIVGFATTTSIENGCDVLEPSTDFCKQYVKDKNTGEPRTDWKRSDLVKVNVSLYDIIEWLEGVDAENNDTAETNDATKGLFEYLSTREDAEEKGYDRLLDYKEYKVDTSVLLKDVGLGQTTFTGEVISASELLKRIHENANKGKELEDSLNILNIIYQEVLKNPDVTNEELNYVIRDISMTRKSRVALNVDEDVLSPVTLDVAKKSSVDIKVPGKGKETHSGDLFNLYSTIENLDPHRVPGYKRELEEDIFRLNKETINNYFSDFALVKSVVDGASDPSYKTTEASIMSTVMWFNINEYFGFNLFPDEYDGSSVSLDNYMRVAYVPIGVFKDPTVSASGEYGYTNVGEYVSLRDNVFNLLVFAVNIIFMIGYGLIKWAVIHIILFLITLYGFLKNYVFRYNPDSNFRLGALVVYGTFILVNIIFNTMWWLFGYAINTSYIANDGAVGYPATLVNSIISILVLGFIIFYVFKKLFNNVRGDLADMGGNNFKKSFSNLLGKMRGAMNGVLTTENRNSSYSEEVRKEGVGGATPEEVKRSNDEGKRNLNQLADDDSIKTSNYIMDELNSSSKVEGEGDTLYGAMKDQINTRTPTGKAMSNLLQDIDSINTDGNSLLSQEDKDLYDSLGKQGTKVTESGNGENISVLGFGKSEEGKKQAEMLTDYLTKKGIKATTEDDNVMFDSGKYDLSTPSGRKTLLEGFIRETADDVSKGGLDLQVVDNKNALSNNFDYNINEDGNVVVGVGGNTGMHPSALAEMLTEDWFRDTYTVEESYKGEGKRGNIVLKPKTDNAEEIDKNLTNLFNLDSKIRDREGYDERKESRNGDVLRFDGANEGVFNEVRKVFDENKGALNGAKLHSNSVALDMTNKNHRKLAKEIKKGLADKYKDDSATAKSIATKVGGYIVGGAGDESPEEVETFMRRIQPSVDSEGNLLFDVDDAKKEVRDKSLARATFKVVDAEEQKRVESVNKQAEEDITDLEKLDKDSLLSKIGKKVPVSIGTTKNAVDSGRGAQPRNASSMFNTQSSGSGLKYGKLDTSDSRIRDELASRGFIGGQVNTTVYGGDNFSQKVESFNDIARAVKGHEKDLERLTTTKDNLMDIVNKKVGKHGTEERTSALLNTLTQLTGTDSEIYDTTRRMYTKLDSDYRSSNISEDRYSDGLATISKDIEKYLRDNNMYDNAIDRIVTDGKMTGFERKTLQNYKSSKSKLVDKGVDSNLLEKLNKGSYHKMMAFVEGGSSVVENEDSQTFDIISDKTLSEKETQDIHKMISEIV